MWYMYLTMIRLLLNIGTLCFLLWYNRTGVGKKVVPRLRECCRKSQAAAGTKFTKPGDCPLAEHCVSFIMRSFCGKRCEMSVQNIQLSVRKAIVERIVMLLMWADTKINLTVLRTHDNGRGKHGKKCFVTNRGRHGCTIHVRCYVVRIERIDTSILNT